MAFVSHKFVAPGSCYEIKDAGSDRVFLEAWGKHCEGDVEKGTVWRMQVLPGQRGASLRARFPATSSSAPATARQVPTGQGLVFK
jgi:hypothetical protein